jgi:sugar lactone lactonase YvrE
MRTTMLSLACFIISFHGTAVAQQARPLETAADSAAEARAAWAAAVRAARSDDTTGARREVDRAAAAWPTQPVYLWNRAVFAAMQSDTPGVRRALLAYAELGLGRDIAATPALAAYRSLPWFGELAERHEANRAPIMRSRAHATLSDSAFFPEGVAFDPKTGSMFVASIRRRTIAEVDTAGRERLLWNEPPLNIGAMLAVAVEPGGEFLWATTGGLPQMEDFTAADTSIAALLRIRISDGTVVGRWDLGSSAPHVLGDVAVGPAGDVFASDSRDPVLYRLAPGAESLEAIRDPLFRSLQGIAPAPGGGVVYVADYSHGILRVDLATGSASRVRDAAGATSLGIDGMVWHRQSLIAIQNGVAPPRVMRFRLDSSGTAITHADVIDRNVAIADEPTIGALVGDTLVYVANSQWERYDDAGARRPGTALAAPVLLALPLR